MNKVLYPWSFDPITFGHEDIINRAHAHFGNLTVAVGVNPEKDGKYTFSLQERLLLARQVLADIMNADVVAFRGMLSDFAWENNFAAVIRWVRNGKDFDMEQEIDYALKRQKLGIETFFMNTTQNTLDLSSSVTKAVIKEQGDVRSYVPLNVKQAMEGRILGQYPLGITGTIWAGKSYATSKIVDIGNKNGIPTYNLDMDQIAKDILWKLQDPKYKEIRATIAQEFGADVQNTDGSIDTKKLGLIVFADSEKMKRLNTILYTPIQVRLRRDMINKKWLLLYNAALIAETNSWNIANNNIVLIDIDETTQAERLGNRGHEAEEIQRRTASQYSTETKAEIFETAIAQDKRGSLTRISWQSNDAELEQVFNHALTKVDTFGELRFIGLLNRLWVKENANKIFAELRNIYDTVGNPHGERKEISETIKGNHHKHLHIRDCLNELYEIKHLLEDADAVECAIRFHDIIYDPKSKTNEEDSALFAENMLRKRWCSEAFIEKVKKLILATKHDTAQTDNDTQYMVDIDMSVVGKEPKIYNQYKKDVRQEYYMATDDLYTFGRSQFLNGMLNKEKIFQTKYFADRYQKQAEINMTEELKELKENKF